STTILLIPIDPTFSAILHGERHANAYARARVLDSVCGRGKQRGSNPRSALSRGNCSKTQRVLGARIGTPLEGVKKKRRSIVPDAEKISSSASSGAGPSARRRSPRRKPAAAQRPVRRRKTTRARRSRLSALLSGLSRPAARAGKQMAVIGEEGISGARRTYEKAETASEKAGARI